MIYNYHTHTARCRHAVDTDEEYVLRAIEGGVKYMGFSDHAPFVFPDGHESHYRIPMSEAQNYFNELSRIREKYRDKIDIKIGFELEYYPDFFPAMLKTARELGAEYLILGQHYLGNEIPSGVPAKKATNNPDDLRLYVDNVIAAIKSGVFTYVAHPDIVNFVGDDELFKSEMTRLCVAAKEYDVPLEINLLGMRAKVHYPSDKFFSIAGEVGTPVTFGFDAHEKESAYDPESLQIATKMVKKHNLNYIGMPKLRSIY